MKATGLDLGAQAGYGVGQIAGQVFRDVPSLLLLFFYDERARNRSGCGGRHDFRA